MVLGWPVYCASMVSKCSKLIALTAPNAGSRGNRILLMLKVLREQFGVGPQTAAVLLSTAGDNPKRLRNEASLAALCGVNPLPASSGKTVRHRLNRGGNRAANNALWTIAMVRMRGDPQTQSYVARRGAKGLSSKEIQRCLKRYIDRELYIFDVGRFSRLSVSLLT